MEENIVSLKEFTNAIKLCPWYEKIFEKYPVIMLYVTGSMLYGVTDERSDYDMVAICDCEKIEKTEPDMFFTWKKKKVHWSWLPLNIYTDFPETATSLQVVGLSYFCHIKNDAIVYKNENYKDTIEKILENKYVISQVGTKKLVKRFSTYINEICELGYIDKKHYSKILAHLCRAYFDLTNTPIDTDFIRSVKRIRWQQVPDDYKKRAAKYIKELRDLYEE